MRILAATDFSTRSHRALRRAGVSAQSKDAELVIVHVVDDDHPTDLAQIERREAERILAEQIGVISELQGARCRPMVVAGDPFDGILRTAQAVEADLIVMGAHRKQLLRDIFVGTTIERVIRAGTYPVLMVNDEVRQPYRNSLVAVDGSEPSVNAIKVAMSMGLIGDKGATLLHAFLPLGKRKLSVAGIDETAINEYVANERERIVDELAEFLAVNKFFSPKLPLRVEEGAVFEVIERIIEETRPDLLVLGTHSRSWLLKVLLGSVAEEALRRVDIDILAVPPVRLRPKDAKA